MTANTRVCICRYCDRRWAEDEPTPVCRTFVCPKRLCEATPACWKCGSANTEAYATNLADGTDHRRCLDCHRGFVAPTRVQTYGH